MDVGKTLMRDRDVLRKKVDVAVSFDGVAGCARGAPVEDQVRANIPGGNEAAGSPATRVSEIVKMLENEVAERLGDERREDSNGEVPVELVASDRVRGDGEGGGVEELLSFGTGEFMLC